MQDDNLQPNSPQPPENQPGYNPTPNAQPQPAVYSPTNQPQPVAQQPGVVVGGNPVPAYNDAANVSSQTPYQNQFNSSPAVGSVQGYNQRKSKKPLIVISTVVILALIVGGGAYALIGHKKAVTNCNSESCFTPKFASCSPAIYNSARVNQTAVKYQIYGKKGSGCNMLFEYTASPDKALANQPMTCNFDNSKVLPDSLTTVLYDLSQGKNSYHCSGSLVTIERQQAQQNLDQAVGQPNSTTADQDLTNYVTSLIAGVAEYISNNNGQTPTDLTAIRGSVNNSTYNSWKNAGALTQGVPAASTIYYSAGYTCDQNTNLMVTDKPTSFAIVVSLSSGKPHCTSY